MKKYKKVFVAGVFDHGHIGHQYLLWKAFELAEEMVVIIARDENVKKIKGNFPQNNEKKRLQRIQEENIPKCTVRLGRLDGKFYKTLAEENPDILFLGYDQKINEKEVLQSFPHIVIHRCAQYFPQYFKSSKFSLWKK